VRPATSQPATASEVTPFYYWSDKPWFCTEDKLVAVLIMPSSWGFPIASTTATTGAPSPLYFGYNHVGQENPGFFIFCFEGPKRSQMQLGI
jgi:hypothetical protein